MVKSLALFGATGSVGSAALDLVRASPEAYALHTLTANENASAMIELAEEFRPNVIVMADPAAAKAVRQALSYSPDIMAGQSGSGTGGARGL